MNYDHYIGLDWAKANMAIAVISKNSNEPFVYEVKSDVKDIQLLLQSLKGTKIITLEESSPAQWLYTELYEHVDQVLVCDPYRNHLLKEGAKTDAVKLVKLLKAKLLRPVFHCTDEFIYLRKLLSGYEDLIKSGVRLKNQKSALFNAKGKKIQKKLDHEHEQFVLAHLEQRIAIYEEQRASYKQRFLEIKNKTAVLKQLESIPDIGLVGALAIAALVVEPKRFKTKNHFLSYCGLVKHELLSGGRSYGKRTPRFCRRIKSVFKTAALQAVQFESNPFHSLYISLMENKYYPPHQARHAVARRIAIIALGVMKTHEGFDAKKLKPII